MTPSDIQRIREVQTDLRAMSHIPEIRELCEANDAKLQAVVDEIKGETAAELTPAESQPQQPYPYEA